MPELVRDMVAWLRFYLIVPFPPLPGEGEAATHAKATEPSAVQAVPLAGAVIGAIGGLVLVLAAAGNLSGLIVAVLTLTALAAITGAAAESGFAETGRRLGAYLCPQVGEARLAHASLAALVFALLLRVGILEGLTAAGPIKAALALTAAVAVARAAAAAVPVFARRPAAPEAPAAPGESADLQYLAIFALAIAAILILPSWGVGAAIGGVGLAIVIAALAEDIARRINAAGERSFAAGVEFAAETAFLFAVLVIARVP
jgi:adenosylcobinamide-GDP ribazoletransferase